MSKTIVYLFLLVFLFGFTEKKSCVTDQDCRSLGSKARCVSQKTGCPGKEATSTCVVKVCDNTPMPTRFANSVKKCDTDADCSLILLKCQCIYCARPGDLENGIADAVNKRYVTDLAKEYACSKEELKQCATAGACADSGKSAPVCRDHKCTIEFRPRN